MKRFITLVIILLALFVGIRYALSLFDIRIAFNNEWAADKRSPTKPAPTGKSDTPVDTSAARELADDLDPTPPPTGQPGFDVVRVDPKGPSVFAGHARPHQNVAVLAEGRQIGTARADAGGNWVLVTDRPLPNPDADLSVAAVSPPNKQPAPEVTKNTSLEPLPRAETVDVVNRRMLESLERMIETARTQGTIQQGAAPAAPAAGIPTQPDQIVTARSPDEEARPDTQSPTTPSTRMVPVPIQFVYREASFTSQGESAARLLLKFLKVAKPKSVSLSGHADDRGTRELNLELSRNRLEAVQEFLRAGGYTGALELVAKGESEPFTAVDRSIFSKDELYQLDRRVELRFDE